VYTKRPKLPKHRQHIDSCYFPLLKVFSEPEQLRLDEQLVVQRQQADEPLELVRDGQQPLDAQQLLDEQQPLDVQQRLLLDAELQRLDVQPLVPHIQDP
jgi:hypothetical protein